MAQSLSISHENRKRIANAVDDQSNGAFRGNYPKLVRWDSVFGYHGSYRLKSQNGDILYNYRHIPIAAIRE